MVDARLHPADVVAHDEKDVGFLLLRRGRPCDQRQHRNQRNQNRKNSRCAFHFLFPFSVLPFKQIELPPSFSQSSRDTDHFALSPPLPPITNQSPSISYQ
jgi:hypothetical protein